MARMVVIYKKPADVEAFERHYFETHIPLVKKSRDSGNTRSVEGPSRCWLDQRTSTWWRRSILTTSRR